MTVFRSAAFGLAGLAVLGYAPPGHRADDQTIYRTVASVIQATPDDPPMIAFALNESYPPQGGDLVLTNFSWDQVNGEQTVGKVTWIDGVGLVGRRTAQGFELTEAPDPTAIPAQSPVTYNAQTDGCAQSTYQPILAKLNSLDTRANGVVAFNEYSFDGHCGAVLTVLFDAVEVRAAVDAVLGKGADVVYDPQFIPVDAAPPPSTGSVVSGDDT